MRSGQILDWSAVDKSALFMLAPLPAVVLGLWRLMALIADPTIEPYFSRPWLRVGRALLAFVLVSDLLFLVGWLRTRRARPDSQGFVAGWLTTWIAAFALGSYLVGAISTPIFGALITFICAAFLFFELRLAVYLASLSVVSVFVPLALCAAGILPYGPAFEAPPLLGGEVSRTWITSTTLLALALTLVPTLLLAEVVRRWQTRDAELLDLARLDPLTHASNRRYFFDRLEVELDRADRLGTRVALVLLDIDFFKCVNDEHGHLAGDAALIHIAELLDFAALRRMDVVGRYGGEEFAILLPDTDREGARAVAERCRHVIESSPCHLPNGRTIRLTASFGVVLPEPGEGVDEVVRRVDEALYRAKSSGRNRVVVAA